MPQCVSEMIREHMLFKLGVHKYNLEELAITEWSHTFEQLMRSRLIMGAFRYSPLKFTQNKHNINSIIKRCKLYQKDGNGEHLVDIANIAMVEFITQKPEVISVDDGEHTQLKEIR